MAIQILSKIARIVAPIAGHHHSCSFVITSNIPLHTPSSGLLLCTTTNTDGCCKSTQRCEQPPSPHSIISTGGGLIASLVAHNTTAAANEQLLSSSSSAVRNLLQLLLRFPSRPANRTATAWLPKHQTPWSWTRSSTLTNQAAWHSCLQTQTARSSARGTL